MSTRTRFLGWQKGIHLHIQSLCENYQLGIRDTAKLRFDFRERGAAQIPSKKRTACGKHFLRQFPLITQFSDLRPDNVLQFSHAPETELDAKAGSVLNCTNFGATRQRNELRSKTLYENNNPNETGAAILLAGNPFNPVKFFSGASGASLWTFTTRRHKLSARPNCLVVVP